MGLSDHLPFQRGDTPEATVEAVAISRDSVLPRQELLD